MFRSKRTLSLLLLVAFVTLTLAAAPSLAVVGGITDLAEFSDPTSPYYGMNWSYNYATKGGTSVAIGYFTLLTADHYYINTMDDTEAGYNTFEINGDTWAVATAKSVPADTANPGDPDYAPPDLRILQMVNLDNQYRPLPGFYDLYTGFFSTSNDLVIVGTGDEGQINIPKTEFPYYELYYTDDADTRDLRWGTNRYKRATREEYTGYRGPHSTQCIKFVYDLPGSKPVTAHENGLGSGDSGGGVFIKVGDTWKLAGINLYQDYYGTATDKFDGFFAARIPTYATRLNTILQDLPLPGDNWLANMLPGDLDGDGNVDLDDYITLKLNYGNTVEPWQQGDFNGDGLIGYQEYLAILANLGYDHSLAMAPLSSGPMPNDGPAAPEPGSALLLAFGAAALLRRRRGGRSKRRNPDKKTAESGTGNKV